MRVLHINSNYIYTTLHQNMISKLDERGISNNVFVPVSDSQAGVIDPIKTVKVVECFNKYDRIWFRNKQKKIYRSLVKSFDIGSFDCIHAYTLFTDGNCALRASQEYNIPYVVAVRNTDVNTFFKYMPHLRHIGVKVLRGAKKVFFLSETYKELVLNNYVPHDLREEIAIKSTIVPNGIDDYWLKRVNDKKKYEVVEERLNRRDIRIIYAGSIDKNKNIGLTMQAVEKLRADGWSVLYTIIGPIKDNAVYQEFKNNTDVKFINKLPKEELIKHYRESDIFVMPSHRETFGLVYAEAMSQGLPVLYTSGQGFDKQFPEGVVGYSVDDKSVDSLFNGMMQVVRNYVEISQACIEKVSVFDWNIICDKYIGFYKDIIDSEDLE